MIFDPVYLLFVLPGLALSMWASRRVKSAFKKYATVRSARGLSGAEGRCCTNRPWPARCPPTGSSLADTI